MARETIRLAFVAALQHLPPRQRAVLILCEVLRWQAAEVAELLETSVASVNSALQRARATLASARSRSGAPAAELDEADRELLDRYVSAFEDYDIEALTTLIQEDATQSMPPFDMWLLGRDDIMTWWFGPGIGCKGSRVIPVGTANGSPAYGQYKPSRDGGYEPWALQVRRAVATAGSGSSRSSSTPSGCSRCSAFRHGSTRSTRASPTSSSSAPELASASSSLTSSRRGQRRAAAARARRWSRDRPGWDAPAGT